MIGRSAMLDAALSYTESTPQWPIFPVHPTTKIPLIKTGADHAAGASTDPEQIERWLRRWPGCGLAIPTGAASGVVVIDADLKHKGEELLAELEHPDVLGPLPRDRAARTRSGGLHLYMARPEGGLRVRTGAGIASPLGRLLGGRPGLDIRADGGIALLPPSAGYSWIRDEDDPLPPIPPLWLAAIQGVGEPPEPPPRRLPPRQDGDSRWSPPERGGAVSDGGRNDALYRRGVMLRANGASDAELIDDLVRMNMARCVPPLTEREIQKIAKSATRSTGRRS